MTTLQRLTNTLAENLVNVNGISTYALSCTAVIIIFVANVLFINVDCNMDLLPKSLMIESFSLLFLQVRPFISNPALRCAKKCILKQTWSFIYRSYTRKKVQQVFLNTNTTNISRSRRDRTPVRTERPEAFELIELPNVIQVQPAAAAEASLTMASCHMWGVCKTVRLHKLCFTMLCSCLLNVGHLNLSVQPHLVRHTVLLDSRLSVLTKSTHCVLEYPESVFRLIMSLCKKTWTEDNY